MRNVWINDLLKLEQYLDLEIVNKLFTFFFFG